MKDELLGPLEAILFAVGEPISINEIANSLNINTTDTKDLLEELQEKYTDSNRGIQLIQIQSKYQLGTKTEFHHYIDDLLVERNKAGLSQAALETLSIVAYKQPVTRIEIEQIRGVKSSSALQTLVDRNLIKEAGRLEAPGKPILYGITPDFLKYAGITTIEELPSFEEFVQSTEESSK